LSDPNSIQNSFLEQVRLSLPSSVSFADELAAALKVSRDSAYRRLRGETALSLDEAKILCERYGLSLDTYLPSSDRVNFQMKAIYLEPFALDKWLSSILTNLETLVALPVTEKHLVYDAKDLPMFHYFQFPELAAFKLFFWSRFFYQEARFDSEKYHAGLISNELITLGEKIWQNYSLIPSTEIIRFEMLRVTTRQIDFLHECRLFTNHEDARKLCDDCSRLANHLKDQARYGYKKTFGSKTTGAKLELYHNDMLIGDNSILFKMKGKRITFITPSNFNILMTSHERFCQLTEDHMTNLINKSILISTTAEKERNKFFNSVEDDIQMVRQRVG
jgi:hypothetical protein